VAGSQKGLMLPPGLSFNAVSEKAVAASKGSKLPKAFWNWEDMLRQRQRLVPPIRPRPTCSMA
jgi:Serine-pyruvate aminotransferase/archaeal aspartate aminotransferase